MECKEGRISTNLHNTIRTTGISSNQGDINKRENITGRNNPPALFSGWKTCWIVGSGVNEAGELEAAFFHCNFPMEM
jgi:hypothetical protein